MSLLGLLGGSLSQGVGGWLAKATGSTNRSLQGDCLDISDVGSYAAKLAKYPQCAPYISSMGPISAAVPAVVAPAIPPGYVPPQVMPGGSTYTPPYTPQMPVALPAAQQISFQQAALPTTPAMTTLGPVLRTLPSIPQLGTMAGRGVASIRKMLPSIRRSDALSVGAIIAEGIAWLNGAPIAKVRRRRRMNPLNYRAALRAGARLCAVRDMTARIEQALPSRGSSPRRRRRTFRSRRRKKCR